jgi:hypothetical protein
MLTTYRSDPNASCGELYVSCRMVHEELLQLPTCLETWLGPMALQIQLQRSSRNRLNHALAVLAKLTHEDRIPN